jgi:hypothetical protein
MSTTDLTDCSVDNRFAFNNQELKVEALGDGAPEAVLTVAGYGQMKRKKDDKYELKLKGAADPGGFVTVTSSLRGTAIKSVTSKN